MNEIARLLLFSCRLLAVCSVIWRLTRTSFFSLPILFAGVAFPLTGLDEAGRGVSRCAKILVVWDKSCGLPAPQCLLIALTLEPLGLRLGKPPWGLRRFTFSVCGCSTVGL